MNKALLPVFALALFAGTSLSGQMMDDAGIFDESEPKAETLLPVSKKPANLDFPISRDCDSFGCRLVLNQPGIVKVQMTVAGEKFKKSFQIRPSAQIMYNDLSNDELTGRAKNDIKTPVPSFPNHILDITSKFFNIRYGVLPSFACYTSEEINKRIAGWEDTIPNALRHSLKIDIKPGEKGLHVYLDGAYAALLPGGNKLVSVNISGGAGPTVSGAAAYKDRTSTPEYEAVDFAPVANPGVMKEAKLSLKPGFQHVDGIPMVVLDGAHSSDLGLVKGLRGLNFTLEFDYYMMRTAWQRFPETQQSAVPNGFYSDAYLLFALDPDPAKDRTFSLRMGRYLNRVVAWATTDVYLPDDDTKFPENIKRIGTAELNGRTIPLYLGHFKIPCGEILDVITLDPYAPRRDFLNFEFMGRHNAWNGFGTYATTPHRPDPNFTSAVNLFGVTFRRAGVYAEVKQSEPGNIFYNDEVPETGVVLTAVRPGTYLFRESILDSAGKQVLRTKETSVTFAESGEKKTFRISLDMPEEGLYGLRYEILENGAADIVHDGSFALLGKDTRLAEPAESPFGSWWTPHHLGTKDPEVFLRLFHKAGIRRISGLSIKKGEILFPDEAKKYKVILNMIGWCGLPEANATEEELEKHIAEHTEPLVRAFPDTKYIMIFHESYGDEYVSEAHGVKGTPSEKDSRFIPPALVMAKWIRKHHPELKIIYGNNTSSQALTAALFRNGFPAEYIDFIGIETPGQGCVPERLWKGGPQGTWYAREVGRTWGRDLKVTGCFEFTMRPERLFDTLDLQAAYFMRDALLGLSYGYETLGISALNDAGGWYPQTLWGSDGMCRRGPLFYPKPVLLAYSTMTKVLDRIHFHPKTLDTGNLSAYALEFDRKSGDHVIAFWVPKGESEMTFEFEKPVTAELVDCFGKRKNVSGEKLLLTASVYPAYLITKGKARSVRHEKTLSPEPPRSFKIDVPFDTVKGLNPVAAPRSLKSNDLQIRAGKFELSEVNDEEMGKCLEVKLIREGTLPDICPEYTRFDLEKPVVLNGTPDEIGLWVKGDGGWGKIGFEIQAARGYRYRNESGNAWEGDTVDFACRSYFNFKGWYFMTYPVDAHGRKLRQQMSLGGRWVAEQGAKGLPVYPIQLNAITVTLRRKTLSLGTMKDAPGVVRFKSFGGITNPEYQTDNYLNGAKRRK